MPLIKLFCRIALFAGLFLSGCVSPLRQDERPIVRDQPATNQEGAAPTHLVEVSDATPSTARPLLQAPENRLAPITNLEPLNPPEPIPLGPSFPIDLSKSSQKENKPAFKPQPQAVKPKSENQIAKVSHETKPKVAASSEAATPDNWEELIGLAVGILEKEIEQKEDESQGTQEERQHARLKKEAYLRLLHLINNDPSQAARPIKFLEVSEREFWNDLLYGLNVYFDRQANPRDGNRKTLALIHLRRAIDSLSTVSNLNVRNVRFCSRVDSYGRFEEYSDAVFRPGQEVILYVEVENFTAEQQSSHGHYETALLGSYEIRDAAQRRAAEHSFRLEKEVCRNRRRDFFIPYRVYFPQHLVEGTYTLQLTIQDVKSNRSGQSTPISLTIKK